MLRSFDTYSENMDALSMDDFLEIHREMLLSIGNDDDALEFYDELMAASITYADIRARWSRMSRDEKRDIDETRTMKHDTVIVRINKLARYLHMTGRDIVWRDRLGYTEEDPGKRRRIGDFACYLAFVAGISAR